MQISIIKGKNEGKKNKVPSMNKSLVGMEESAGAVIERCSVNEVFWKIVENSQWNTCAG